MQFDDRLATVLRNPAHTEAGARTQYRQLIDLLGSLPRGARGEMIDGAQARLNELAAELPAADQSRILRELGLRLRSPELVAQLAQGEPQAAAAAMATARLEDRDWLELIPQLPITARGFLRHRRDLPQAAREVLARLGVRDLVLPEPQAAPKQPGPPSPVAEVETGIAGLVRRIEAFQRQRHRRDAGPAPAADIGAARHHADFSTDVRGTIVWADGPLAAQLIGVPLRRGGPAATATLDPAAAQALSRRLPLSGRLDLDGGAAGAGAWRIDAAPRFDGKGGYLGHAGRLRRPPPPAPLTNDTPGERMRQVLHELRTPVNAMQGFAEIIQQQLFGAAPHEYRALAGAIAVDAARLMAGFDDLDRLARLESGALTFDEGSCDLGQVLGGLLRRVEGVLRPRSARMMLVESGSAFEIAMAEPDALQFAWRLVATLAGAVAPGEVIELQLDANRERVRLRAELPATLSEESDVFGAGAPLQRRAVSAGMFGSGFALRLARVEAEAAGGTLVRDEDVLVLDLPALTLSDANNTAILPG